MKDELERIASIRRRMTGSRADVLVGIGDDAAVLASSQNAQAVTVDTAVEGVHFRRDLLSWRDVSYRSFVIAVSDLAAMGARPRTALVAMILPSDLDDAFDEMLSGIAEASEQTGAQVVGGNLSAGGEVSITTTVIGELDGDALTRAGARPGDGIYVTGTVGAGALGLALIEAGRGDEDDPDVAHYVQRWRRPTAALMHGQRLQGHATAAIDISDGLVQDLAHICEASGTGADVFTELLPVGHRFAELARELGADPSEMALTSGDDYELLFTAPASEAPKRLATRIGRITSAPGELRVLDPHGEPLSLRHLGYRHFE